MPGDSYQITFKNPPRKFHQGDGLLGAQISLHLLDTPVLRPLVELLGRFMVVMQHVEANLRFMLGNLSFANKPYNEWTIDYDRIVIESFSDLTKRLKNEISPDCRDGSRLIQELHTLRKARNEITHVFLAPPGEKKRLDYEFLNPYTEGGREKLCMTLDKHRKLAWKLADVLYQMGVHYQESANLDPDTLNTPERRSFNEFSAEVFRGFIDGIDSNP